MKDHSTREQDNSTFSREWEDEDDVEDETPHPVVGKGETKAVVLLRLAVLTILGLLTTGVSSAVYYYGHQSEIDTFKNQFEAHATKVTNAFTEGASRRVKAMKELSMSLTAEAIATGQSWPFVSLTDFERRAALTLDLAGAVAVILLPVVPHGQNGETRARWELYSVENQAWLIHGLMVQENHDIARVAELLAIDVEQAELLLQMDGNASATAIADVLEWELGQSVVPRIHSEVDPFPLDTRPEYNPVWQISPAVPFFGLVNANAFEREMEYLKTHNTIFALESYDYSSNVERPTRDITGTSDEMQQPGGRHLLRTKANDPFRLAQDHHRHSSFEGATRRIKTVTTEDLLSMFVTRSEKAYDGGPFTNIVMPVFDSNEGDGNLVAGITTFMYWLPHFENVLPEKANGVICVLDNIINQSFTFEINGPTATFIGVGDYHDTEFSSLEVSTPYGAYLGEEGGNVPLEDRVSAYRIRLYPSARFRNDHLSKLPKHFAMILAATFVATVMVFLIYDTVVEKRQRVVLSEAIKTGKVVHSLFPDTVRDRLYDNKPLASESSTTTGWKATKKRGSLDFTSSASTSLSSKTAPIADLYPDCTVLFADIKGFTKWSSQREPVEVFTLLETLYGAFDKSARKLKVFKIETIGDCYLAVTGIPEPQADHAVIMSRFAVLLDMKMNELAQQLVSELGSDTCELQMRVGLHSGSVTAGVLRGEKARFQLFGDTVNTASRMESTGDGGRIQISQATADFLIAANRENWLEPRETLVEAKGKGSMQTYWLVKESVYSSSEAVSEGSTSQTDRMSVSIADKIVPTSSSVTKAPSAVTPGSTPKHMLDDLSEGEMDVSITA